MFMGDTHCMELIVAVGMTVTIVVVVMAVLMDMLVAVGYAVMSMLMAVSMGMLMAVFAVKTFVHSCLLSAEQEAPRAQLTAWAHHILVIIYTFSRIINCKLKQIREACRRKF